MTAVAYGIALPASRGVLTPQAYSAPAEAFFVRLAAQPTQVRKALYDAMIRSLVSAGLWSKLDALYIFAAADQATALTNLVSANYGATAINAPSFAADRGFTGASTKYIDTNFNPATASSPNFTQNAASAGGWSLTSAAVAGPIIGNKTLANGTVVYSKHTNGNAIFFINSNLFNTFAAVASGAGLIVGSRTSSSAQAGYQNAALIASHSANPSQAPLNSTMSVLYGDGGSYATGLQAAAAFIGGSLSAADVAALYDALHAYMQAVAGVA